MSNYDWYMKKYKETSDENYLTMAMRVKPVVGVEEYLKEPQE